MNNVIVALDFETVDEVLNFLHLFDKPIFVKVGMELFYNAGPEFIKEIKKLNHKIFLDLKSLSIRMTGI